MRMKILKIKRMVHQALLQQWYHIPTWIHALLPLSVLYRMCDIIYRKIRAIGAKRFQGEAQLWVVGNISIGGSHKTPCVLALAKHCLGHNQSVAIISHGYGANNLKRLLEVTDQHTAFDVGDEALLLKKQSGVPVVIAKKRKDAILYLKERSPVIDVMICDDGLQDTSILPDKTFALMADQSLPINQYTIPAGPFRDPLSRLNKVDVVLTHPGNQLLKRANAYPMHYVPSHFQVRSKSLPLDHFKGKSVPVFTAIARPDRFADTLKALGVDPLMHVFPDHHRWTDKDFKGFEGKQVVMTSKDAVKMDASYGVEAVVLVMRFTLPSLER